MSVIIDVVVYIANSLLKQLPKIVKLGLNLIVALAKGIAQAIPQLLPTIVEVITEIVSMISDPAMLSELLDAALEIIMALSDGLVDAIPQLLQAVSILMQGLYTFFIKPENMVKMAEAGINLIIALGAAIVKAIPVFLEYWVNLITSIVDNFKNTNWSELGTSLVESIKNGISRAWAGITQWFNGIWNQLFGNRNVNINVSKGASGVAKPIMPIMFDGSHAMGLDYVPFDGYIAELHKGERILTAKEAKEYGKSVSFGNVIIQVDGRSYDEERLAVAISERLQIMTERRESVFA
jgi:phage-related protein